MLDGGEGEGAAAAAEDGPPRPRRRGARNDEGRRRTRELVAAEDAAGDAIGWREVRVSSRCVGRDFRKNNNDRPDFGRADQPPAAAAASSKGVPISRGASSESRPRSRHTSDTTHRTHPTSRAMPQFFGIEIPKGEVRGPHVPNPIPALKQKDT